LKPFVHIHILAFLLVYAACGDSVPTALDATSDIASADQTSDQTSPAPKVCDPAINPGQVTLHRLNRAEYNNTVRDLMGDESQPAIDFPADDHGHGYDNNANVLAVSPLLIEKYDRAAEQLVDAALELPNDQPVESAFEAQFLEATTGGGGTGFWNLWSNGEVLAPIEITKAGTYIFSTVVSGQQAGPDLVQIELRINSVPFAAFEVAAYPETPTIYTASTYLEPGNYEYGVAFINDYYMPDQDEDRNLLVYTLSMNGPFPDNPVAVHFEAEDMEGAQEETLDQGLVRLGIGETLTHTFHAPTEGTYLARLRAGINASGSSVTGLIRVDDNVFWSGEVISPAEAATVIEESGQLSAGTHTLSVSVDSDNADAEIWVDWAYISGNLHVPEPTPSDERAQIMLCSPDEGQDLECARTIFEAFADRAWRRPVTDEELDRLVQFVTLALEEVADFETGIRLGLQAILLSPHFLYRVELDPIEAGTTTHPLNDYELASRLSYFLWSSMPDEELLALAQAQQLQDPQVIETQVRRMIADPKARSLTDNFAGQWLYTRKLADVFRDSVLFPEFNDDLSASMRTETELFFEWFLSENHNVLNMLDANFTFMDSRLSEFYDIPLSGDGSNFETVTTDGSVRNGLLTQGTLLTVTSHTFRTSPVKRGKWVLSQLMCQEPPAPPPGVESLPEPDETVKTLRERLELHRTDPVCAACHLMMDPIGLGMENFDAIGAWRDTDHGEPIDASGVLPGELYFDGVPELAQIIKADPATARCITRHMFVYALGRGETALDSCGLDDITDAWAKQDYGLGDLMVFIAQHELFRTRQAESTEGVQ